MTKAHLSLNFWVKNWTHSLLGSLYLICWLGYRLRPDNSHQYWLLSQSANQNYPPLPWLNDPPHQIFSSFTQIFSNFFDTQIVFFSLQILAILFFAIGVKRLCNLFFPSGLKVFYISLVAIALLTTYFFLRPCLLKHYLTPGSLSEVLSVWSVIFILERKFLAASITTSLMLSVHLSFFPLAFLLAFWIIFNARHERKKCLWILGTFFLLKSVVFIHFQQWELLELDTFRYRGWAQWPTENLISRKGFGYLISIGFVFIFGWVSLKKKSHMAYPIIYFSLIGIFSLLIPLKWQIIRISPLIEWLAMILFVGFIIQKIKINNFYLICVLCLIIFFHYKKRQFYITDFFQKDVLIKKEFAPLFSWVRNNTDSKSVFVIPPSFISFKSGAQRQPWVDVAALPWNLKDQSIWDHRLKHLLDQPNVNWKTFEGLIKIYDLPLEEILKRAQATKADYLVWPSKYVHQKTSYDWIYKDEFYSVAKLRP